MKITAQRNGASRLRQRIATLMLLLSAANLWAQQPAEDSQTRTTQTPASETKTPAPVEPTAATSGEEAVADTPASANSPFDYRASEKISEDLSVSFPVDI